MDEVDVFLLKVYDLFFTVPFEGMTAEEREDFYKGRLSDADDTIKSDRFELMAAVRELRNRPQKELPLDGKG